MGAGKIRKYAELLRSGKISSVELTKEYLKKIEVLNPEINAYVSVNAEKALQAAKAADERIASGKADTLTGIPFAIKDNIATKGEETTCCSRILKGYRPTYDATVYEKLCAHGAVVLGKNNMDEFAMGSSTETSCYGAAYN
ncbi:MAG: Asp-tRNA(Asn)/Glu-tRNA(Gln) amidotransferase subunit GatA, partial [Firmicutes bacterium]|nr:Asp-tRNA(Asn)/Glu-tRNA(Gln) amidotransferase subunit GatA [Candidatus Stercoripulliclostridium pullicola]